MTRRQNYFLKQKLIGLGMIIVGIIITVLIEDAGVINYLTLPMGLVMLFTKEMIWMDDYFFEMEERKEFKRKMRQRSRR